MALQRGEIAITAAPRKQFMRRHLSSLLGVLAPILMLTTAAAAPAGVSSEWVQGHGSRARLIGGGAMVGVELQLPEGWKTYWRTPGEAGGVAPAFDWSGSSNLASAEVLYPAPKRFTDRLGDTIGYKGSVTFPVRLTAEDASRPIEVKLAVDYGVCKDICVPARADLALTVPPDAPLPAELAEAVTRVPSTPEARRAGDPVLKRAVAELTGDKPRLLLETDFPAGTAHADAFVEASDGLYVPMTKKIADDGKGAVTFEIDLSKDVDLAALKGKELIATIVSGTGQSEARFPLQ
jgi:DsbC/DsbD-like thiol-disulfide interchange protein